MYGTGTHNLPIYASEGSETKFNLWMIDSNDYDRVNGGYDYVHQDQIDWYEKTSKALEEKEGHLVPSIAFQHIIVPEVAELLVDSPFKGENAISKKLNGQNKLLMLKPGKASGMMLEFPCPSNTNSGEFASWKSAATSSRHPSATTTSTTSSATLTASTLSCARRYLPVLRQIHNQSCPHFRA